MFEIINPNLAPLDVDERTRIALLAIDFFSIVNTSRYKQELSITNRLPLAFNDFIRWRKNNGDDLFPRISRVFELISILSQKKCLIECGHGIGSPPYNQRYFCMLQCTKTERMGIMHLGKYLGLEFTASEIIRNLVHITGESKKKDLVNGSGILVTSQIVLTCAHVILDMKVDDQVEIYGNKHKIIGTETHPIVDMGVLLIEDHDIPFHKDIALRKAALLEQVLIAGFPRVPRNLNPCPLMQSGEIAGRIESYNDDSKRIELELFTAISRPGNSGGPMLSADGKLLGIVTQSLERQTEEIDNEQTILPCFAAVPADVVFKSFSELKVSQDYELPWEDYRGF